MRPYKYNFINDPNKIKRIGLMAQDAEIMFPESVFETVPDGENTRYLALDYNAITALLVGKVNEYEEKIKNLEERLAKLEK